MRRPAPVALVTGGAHRLGGALTRHVSALGYDVALHYHQSQGEAEALEEALAPSGRRVVPLQGDLRTPGAPEALAERVLASLGPPSLVIHSAASFHRGTLLETGGATLEATLRLNLMAPILLTRALAAPLRQTGGMVVFLGDLSGEQGWLPYGAHSVAKAGLEMAKDLLAQEFGPDVRVNTIAPGDILPTDGSAPPLGKVPLGRQGRVEDVLMALDYLLRAEYVTGETLHVDGGRSARRT